MPAEAIEEFRLLRTPREFLNAAQQDLTAAFQAAAEGRSADAISLSQAAGAEFRLVQRLLAAGYGMDDNRPPKTAG